MTDIGVVYLARGADPNWRERITRFVNSWITHPPGMDCHPYVILKEFATPEDLTWAISELDPLQPTFIMQYIDHNAYAGGSFMEASEQMKEPLACYLGSTSDIMHSNWLARLHEGYMLPGVGAVCCTGSWGFITEFNPGLSYPNPHMRNLSFMMEREWYHRLASKVDWTPKPGHKLADLNFEHGPHSLTKQILAAGMKVLVVEKNRIIEPHEWGDTTYRGNMQNVLIHDRGARDYNDL